ncbi:MAG: DNA polymerase III subunit delta [Actinomycetes bacterium]
MKADPGVPIHVVKGGDEILLAEAASDLVHRLLAGAERAEHTDEFGGDDYELGAVVAAALTVSMFGDRLVVARNCGRFSADDVQVVIDYLADPSPTATVVLVWDRPASSGAKSYPVSKRLTDALTAVGGQLHDAGLPAGKARGAWIEEHLAESPVQLSSRAREMLLEQLGDDLSRLGGVLTVLEATYGTATIDPEDLAPFLGEAGSIPPWELTDAIDSGDVPGAVEKVRRMLIGGERHPLQVMSSLTTHFERMMRLDGSGIRDDKTAAAHLGMKGSSFPAKRALAQGAKLGHDQLVRAMQLLATADLALRGTTEQSGQSVMETLVARLAAMSRRSSPAQRGRR